MTALQRDARAMGLEDARSVFFGAVGALLELASANGFSGNLWQVSLAFLLASHENAFSTALEIGGEVSEGLRRAALHDMYAFRSLFCVDLAAIGEALSTSQHRLLLDFEAGDADRCRLGRTIRARLKSLAEELAGAADEESFLEALEVFYREYGVGRFGLHKAFRIEHLPENGEGFGAMPTVVGNGIFPGDFADGHAPDAFGGGHLPDVSFGMRNAPGARIVPVTNVRQVTFDDLVGYEDAKKLLIDNTEAFVEKRMANNCLLYGEAGTGKSSSIKALLHRFFDRGLRIIEITRYDFRDLHGILEEIKNRNYRFILYMDDLSFEENETEYKFLKAVIEGGLEKKPENVLLYATSNRRHLIRENYRDKEDRYQDMHASDTVQEKLSLSARFGLQIYFGAPEKKQYEEIVLALARRNGIELPEKELLLKANAWELRRGGYSGRAAQQFIDDLLSNKM
ncbi:MAG: ATP-binding protein [bacterium]